MGGSHEEERHKKEKGGCHEAARPQGLEGHVRVIIRRRSAHRPAAMTWSSPTAASDPPRVTSANDGNRPRAPIGTLRQLKVRSGNRWLFGEALGNREFRQASGAERRFQEVTLDRSKRFAL
jgi:hypothetical protein